MDWDVVVAYQKFFGSDAVPKYRQAVVVLEALGYEPIYIGGRGVLHVIGRYTAYEWMRELHYEWNETIQLWDHELPF